MKKIKNYLNTFKGDSVSQRFRRFGFNILSLLYALIIALYFASINMFENQFLALIVDVLCGYTFITIIDLTFGIGRKSPLIKINK